MAAPEKFNEYLREIRFLHRALFGMIVAVLVLGIAYLRFPRTIEIQTAPDISKSFVQKIGEVPPATVYGFARTLWETLNYCAEDCGEEYPQRLKDYSPYLTRNCYRDLSDHFERNRSLFNFRSRLLLPTENAMYSSDNIRQISSDAWYVKVEYELRDLVNGTETRKNLMLYPLRIVRSDKPRDVNPFGLDVDCYFDNGPVVLSRPDEKGADADNTADSSDSDTTTGESS